MPKLRENIKSFIYYRIINTKFGNLHRIQRVVYLLISSILYIIAESPAKLLYLMFMFHFLRIKLSFGIILMLHNLRIAQIYFYVGITFYIKTNIVTLSINAEACKTQTIMAFISFRVSICNIHNFSCFIRQNKLLKSII